MCAAANNITIIIPVLNEASIIASRLRYLLDQNPDAEILIVDGGSQDRTIEIANQMGIRVISSAKGRGIQCNAGARQASGDILMFLHIDTQLPKDAFRQLNRYFQDERIQIGTFQLLFDHDHWALKTYAFFTRFDTVFTKFGDQCIIVRKNFFDRIGGFPDWPCFEDIHFLRCARKYAKIYTFAGPVVTSARKFVKNGIFKQQAVNSLLIARYLMGTKPEVLYKDYYR